MTVHKDGMKRYDVELPTGIIHVIEVAGNKRDAVDRAVELNPRFKERHKEFRATESQEQRYTKEIDDEAGLKRPDEMYGDM